jgi:hypothetical protein
MCDVVVHRGDETMIQGTHIALSSPVRIMRFVRHDTCWDIWVSMDRAQSGDYGTFYRLHDSGMCERHTLDGEANIDVVLIKPADKE